MKYVVLGFFDEAAFAQIPQADAQRMMEECLAYDDVLRRGGHFLGGEALDSARNAVTLRMKDGEVQVTDGPSRWRDDRRPVGLRRRGPHVPRIENTLANVFSTTKNMTSLAALVLVDRGELDRGELDLDANVAAYWPEFATRGKAGSKVRQHDPTEASPRNARPSGRGRRQER